MSAEEVVFSNSGMCSTCDQETVFTARNAWFRDHYVCEKCGSIPRERALMKVIESYYPHWRDLKIHESSPCGRGASLKLRAGAQGYLATQFFPGLTLGVNHQSGWRNENLENQTFPDGSFDLVVTQDVFEHIFDPAKAFAEIARTLKPGGAHIFTVPIVNKQNPSKLRAFMREDGEIEHVEEPQYHGNPVDPKGSLVTMDWGYDISEYILKTAQLYTTIVYIDDISSGIRAEYIEVLVSRKVQSL
jgi:SAM-dependent methyltransferase